MMLGWAKGLSTRAANALIAFGYTSKEQLLADTSEDPSVLRMIPNVGYKAYNEIIYWLGIPNPQLRIRIKKYKTFLEEHGYTVTAPVEEGK